MLREKAIEEHRKMWHWLAENPGSSKLTYLRIHYGGAKLFNDCFLCQYAAENCGAYMNMCDCCPLEWPGDKCTEGGDGLYVSWLNVWTVRDYEQTAKIALQIAELPEVKK